MTVLQLPAQPNAETGAEAATGAKQAEQRTIVSPVG
jgi:hypothetical protein